MKAELVKRQDRWDLYGEDGSKIASSAPNPMGKLSIKNCEAIANSYDLDELTNRAFDNMEYHSTVTPHEEKQFKLGYRVAFREALEILGDKKFSEKDMKLSYNANEEGWVSFNAFMEDLLQQTEWDVEIDVLMTEREGGVVIETPKLDSNGNLILKRI
jgi:hypothetical protein